MKTETYMGYEYGVDELNTRLEQPEVEVTMAPDFEWKIAESSETDRFDLEEQMMDCWRVTDDIETIYAAVMDDDNLTKDNIANALLGLHELYELKFSKLNSIYEQLLREGKI
jgi:hypothetical protein